MGRPGYKTLIPSGTVGVSVGHENRPPNPQAVSANPLEKVGSHRETQRLGHCGPFFLLCGEPPGAAAAPRSSLSSGPSVSLGMPHTHF